ncbi:hypothetical protein GQ600_23319 [Phytophthora cactorum]|nr:hypothetical protein GQ600_23319 [Phytophthora cactorum]
MATKIPWVSEKPSLFAKRPNSATGSNPTPAPSSPRSMSWACRTLITLYMKGLQDIIGVSVVHPLFQRTRSSDPEDDQVG